MIQSELADKLDYNAGKMNKYKFISEYCGKYKILFNVSPNVFYPKPKVNSKVVKLSRSFDSQKSLVSLLFYIHNR